MAERAAWRRRILAGAARSGEAPSLLPPLAALALAAQRDRFERPAPMGVVDFGEAAEDPRPILPDAARIPFRRLLRQKAGPAGQVLVRGAFTAMRSTGARPHPFDLPAAEPWLGQLEPLLGPAERAYRHRAAGAPPQPVGDGLEWIELTPAERVKRVRELRQADPAAGRALLEAHLTAEAAASRAGLVQALSVGLGPDDRELLTALLAARAQAVKAAAADLLARTPGAEGYGVRLDAAVALCTVKKVGLFDRRRKLELAPAAKGQDPVSATVAAFAGVRLGDLAARLGSAPEDLFDGTSDPLAALALAVCGLAEGRSDILARLAAPLAEYGAPFLAVQLRTQIADLAPAVRTDLFSGYVEAALPATLYALPNWGRLLEIMEGPLSAGAARALIHSAATRTAIAEAGEDQKARAALDALTGLAAAMPRACAGELSALLATLGPLAGPARDFADFLSALPDTSEDPR